MSEHLVIGMGEVGKAIQQVFGADAIDKGMKKTDKYKFVHLCYPYDDNFLMYAQNYQQCYSATYTIIHSTVPVGTSRKINALHSPVRGLHPNLYEGLLTFPKFIGGADASLVADVFRKAGMKVILCDKQEETEAMKLFDTQYYLECVRFVQRVKKFCNQHQLDFHAVYTLANTTYNTGYAELGYPEYMRPVLQPIMKEVGGHCLLNNEKLLNENAVGTSLKKVNEIY